MKIAIINYGMENLRSVVRKIERLGFEPMVTFYEKEIKNCDKLILPGVGHFSKGIKNLDDLSLIDIIRDFTTV